METERLHPDTRAKCARKSGGNTCCQRLRLLHRGWEVIKIGAASEPKGLRFLFRRETFLKFSCRDLASRNSDRPPKPEHGRPDEAGLIPYTVRDQGASRRP